ncbi:helix-turn-helix domain-containing protein [Corynebacterium sp. UBA2622]|uniref:helix-turn-helix domain-containing protein n=1 Tax=Corynebacterium sp. UBA2622 TaxID=1946393 RepID=UPI0025C125AB|nr:helix-turn-helix transcriptional regulator [Corynebacterium sp. UBA2622]
MATTTLLLDNPTASVAHPHLRERVAGHVRTLDAPHPPRHGAPGPGVGCHGAEHDSRREPLLREALGMSLRAYRADKGVTLRNLASQARVSSGYLSELERGRKEVSSELLQSICEALDTTVAEVLFDAVSNLSLHSITDELEQTAPSVAEA